MNIAAIWGAFWPIAVAILLFLVMIIIHEFGHFIAAKLLGVRVNEFAVGFGPKLFSRKKKTPDFFSLRLIFTTPSSIPRLFIQDGSYAPLRY